MPLADLPSRWALVLGAVGLLAVSCEGAAGGGAGPDGEAVDAGVPDAAAAVEDAGKDAGPSVPGCAPGEMTGSSAGSDEEATAEGLGFHVRVPASYDPTVRWPLIVVYAPAGADASDTEGFVNLTPVATERGYLVAYADHVSPDDLEAAGCPTIPALVASKWCVDDRRVYLTGHSDGGSIAMMMVVHEQVSPAAIAPSAAPVWVGGQVPCPPAVSIMLMHSAVDALCPATGVEDRCGGDLAYWWASCDQCGLSPGEPLPNGCIAYAGCQAGTEVQFCQGDLPHGYWPGLEESIVDFFDRFALP